jgi:hypothetical protein
MTRRDGFVVAVMLICLQGASPASGTVIDFNSLTPGSVPGGVLNLTAGGVPVAFSGTGLQVFDLGSPFFERVLATGNFQDPITVTFGGGFTALLVEIENHIDGALSAEVDVIAGEAFDAVDFSLDVQTNSNETHHLDGPGIVKVVYDDVASGFAIDNFTFQSVPEPGGLVLTCLGLICLARRTGNQSAWSR